MTVKLPAERKHQSADWTFSPRHRETCELSVTAFRVPEPSFFPFFLIPFHLSYTTHRCHIVSGRTKEDIFPLSQWNARWVFRLSSISCLQQQEGPKRWRQRPSERQWEASDGSLWHWNHTASRARFHMYFCAVLFYITKKKKKNEFVLSPENINSGCVHRNLSMS